MDKRLVTHINWGLFVCILALFLVGMANLYSASAVRTEDGLRLAPFYQKQLVWGGIGFCAMLACMVFDYRHLKTLALPIFLLSVLLLAMVPLFGVTINGAKRWISLAFFNLQPSELAKISVLLLAAAMLSRRQNSLDWGDLFLVTGVCGIPCIFIFLQPDLGTTLNILLLLGGIILFQGIRRKVFKTICILVPPLLPLGWFMLAEYQKTRILTFLNILPPDPQGAGYHIKQSFTAIGSGQMWGKGFLGGTQSLLRFLPEKHSDFAIAVFSEEWGFVGCVSLVVLFCLFLLCIISTARDAKDRFGSLLAAGVFFYFFWQILVNIGMVVGLLPVVGIPLPFFSYGGTAMVVNFIMLGLVMNVSMRRFVFKTH